MTRKKRKYTRLVASKWAELRGRQATTDWRSYLTDMA